MADQNAPAPTSATAAATPAPAAAAAPPVAGAAAPVDPAKPPETKPKEPQLSPQLAKIAKAEMAARKEREAIKTEREAIKAEREQLRADADARAALKKADPLKWLEKEGYTYQQITDFAISGKLPAAAEPKPADPEVASLKQQLDALKKRDEDREAAAVKAANEKQAAEYRAHTFAEVKKAGEKFELVNALGDQALEMVWARIVSRAQETADSEDGAQVLTPEEAAAEVEAALEADLEKIKPVLTTKKGGAKLLPAPSTQTAVPAATSEARPSSAVRTLTNSHVAAPPPAKPRERELSWSERVKLAKEEINRQG